MSPPPARLSHTGSRGYYSLAELIDCLLMKVVECCSVSHGPLCAGSDRVFRAAPLGLKAVGDVWDPGEVLLPALIYSGHLTPNQL